MYIQSRIYWFPFRFSIHVPTLFLSVKIDFGAVCIFAAMSGKMFPYNSANIGRGWNEKKMQRERYLSCMEFLTKVHF